MSWKAVQAVRDNSKQKDPTSRLILMVIASYCNHKLNMNNAKNTPSAAKIAEGAGCHINTAKKHIVKLLETDELSVKKEGSGRGTKMRYTIHLGVPLSTDNYPSDVPLNDSNGTPQSVPISDNGTPTSTDSDVPLKEMVHDLKLMVHDLKLMVHGMVHNGTRASRVEDDSKGSKGLSKGLSKGKDTHTPNNFISHDSITETKPSHIITLEKDIKGLVRNPNDYATITEAAWQAFENDITGEDLLIWFTGKGCWWFTCGMGKKDFNLPYAKNILNDMLAAKHWSENKGNLNGVAKKQEFEVMPSGAY